MKITFEKGLGVFAGLAFVGLLTWGFSSNTNKNSNSSTEVTTPDLLYPVQSGPAKIKTKTKVLKSIDADLTNSVFLIGEVNTQSISTAIARLLELGQSNEEVFLFIDSPGGSVLDGEMLISAMESSSAEVHTVCVSICASMGAAIHAYGKQRYAFDRAVLMYHDAAGGARGELDQMTSIISMFQRKIDKGDTYTVGRSKMAWEEFQSLKGRDLWIDSEDAKDKGLVDDLVKYPAVIGKLLTSPDMYGKIRRNRMYYKFNDFGTDNLVEINFTNGTLE